MQNKSQVYKSEYDIHVLFPQEKESPVSLPLLWLQGKGHSFAFKGQNVSEERLNHRGMYER